MFAVPQEIKIITVTKLNRFAKQVLESEVGQVWVSGEISNFTRAASGHWYFTLKDDNAQVRTCMFKGANQKLSFTPKHGDKVVVRANLSLYEARGDYQLIAVHMEPEGIGRLKQAFEALKVKLQGEGLFAQETKHALPKAVSTIGVVTSPTGAAIHDILHVLKRRNPAIKVIVYPSMVQGEGAAQTIAAQIETANRRKEVDVLIVGRGGGSLEDLWSFNEEVVARAIFASTLPIVSAVGHEVDVTIADFVADVRAATPSAAAEMLSEDWQELETSINTRKRSLMRALHYQLDLKLKASQKAHDRLHVQHPAKLLMQHNQSVDYLYARLSAQHPNKKIQQQIAALEYLQKRLYAKHPNEAINAHAKSLDSLNARLSKALRSRLKTAKQQVNKQHQALQYMSPAKQVSQGIKQVEQSLGKLQLAARQQIKSKQSQFANMSGILNTVSPLATLSRGYSITLHNDEVLNSSSKVAVGDVITTKLADGEMTSKVLSQAKK